MPKAMTLRLQDELARELEIVARIDAVSVSDAVREAIAKHVATRRSDQAFQERLDKFMSENQAILERLAQ